jgi:hypothetical protein
MIITRDLAAKVLDVVDAGLCRGLGEATPGKMCVEAAVCYALGLPHGDCPPCVAPSLRAIAIRLNDQWSLNTVRTKGLRRLAVAQLGSAGHLDEREFVQRVLAHAIGIIAPLALRSASFILKNEGYKAALLEAAMRCEKEKTTQAVYDAGELAAGAALDARDARDALAARGAIDAAAAAVAVIVDASGRAAWQTPVVCSDLVTIACCYASNASAAHAAEAYANPARAAAEATYARDSVLSDYAEAIVRILIEMKTPGCQWLDLCEVG